MASKPLTLGFDTSAAHCAAALLRGDEILAATAQEMGRGQAENLMPLIEDMLSSADVTWADLDRIGVGIGPGNFTGIRISVSAARGLALALDIPAIGVSTFDAITQIDAKATPAVPAPRDLVYVTHLGPEPQLLPIAEAQETAPLTLPPAPRELAIAIAQVAAKATPGASPAPMYIKPADAAPSRDVPPRILT
ncbi:tRNA threonylcarbamoyl adenosine modification protein YeaZ [Thalassococcus halodurans]|uniref:tRNA threonylcarbamoyl adenosine modification protein YeaZ n=1 Tax=Thalassococcus halodurans TaxID=373675 RepID=A0A1H6AMU1_9RHOB|nr:tRNA (adenosine(37)-N6)-threonylcarbamoyltransferase complex dimerization subunit type 1 TsaB [Thalassococcus halodurans]SEG50053.1 tRNA threonylcarbamoyl adenosine modification protein YeaZ [Thalassococcus halodurans]